MGLDGVDAGSTRDRGLPELRRRPTGSSPRHPVRHQGRRDGFRRGSRAVGGADRSGRDIRRPVCRRRRRASCRCRWNPTSPAWRFRRNVVVHQSLAEGGLRSDRKAGRRHRHRLDRCSAHPRCGPGSAAALRVPAFAGVHPAVAGTPIRARRAGRDEGPLRRNPSGPAGTPDRGCSAERLLGAARDA